MRWLSPRSVPDELIGMAYYGQGIGRYFGGNTFGQDALSNIGLPGTAFDFTLDPLPTYGATVAYRHFWIPELRSNFVYSYASQQYPSYALFFVPGSVSATSLNSTMEQAIVNLIWSPFAELRGNTVGTGWLDVGLEYVYSHRRSLAALQQHPGWRRLCHRQPRPRLRHYAVLKTKDSDIGHRHHGFALFRRRIVSSNWRNIAVERFDLNRGQLPRTSLRESGCTDVARQDVGVTVHAQWALLLGSTGSYQAPVGSCTTPGLRYHRLCRPQPDTTRACCRS